MKCILSHTSACIWYARHESPRTTGERAARVSAKGASMPGLDRIAKLKWMLGLEDVQLDFLVDDRRKLRSNNQARAHLCTMDLPAGSLIQIPSGSDDIALYITSPELTFCLMSFRADVLASVYAGMSLCSDYRLDIWGVGGVVSRIGNGGPITTVSRIERYLSRASGITGVIPARKSLKYVREHARSPKESSLAMFYGLPAVYGGMALGDVVLNPVVNVYAGKDRAGDIRYERRYPDILISRLSAEGSRLAVAFDYDSDAAHGGREKALEDKRRANSIATLVRLVHFSVSTDDLGDLAYLRLLGDRARRVLKGRVQPVVRGARDSADARRRIQSFLERQRDLWSRFVDGGVPY